MDRWHFLISNVAINIFLIARGSCPAIFRCAQQSDYYLFDNEVGCCGLWYPGATDCPDTSSATPVSVDFLPDVSEQFYYPHLTGSNCRQGRHYPQWMMLSPRHYLYTTPEDCCNQWYPALGSQCPSLEDDGVQEGHYWENDEAFYPNFNGDGCARGNSYPPWMTDPLERDTQLFRTGEECCDFWFTDTTLDCQANIVTVIDGRQVGGPDATGTWYPSLNGRFQCIDGTPPLWMTSSDGYMMAYVFDSQSECCKAHFCQQVRGDIFS